MPTATQGDVPTQPTLFYRNPAALSTDYLMGYQRGLFVGRLLGPSGAEEEISDEQHPYHEEEVRLHTTELRDRPDSEKLPLTRRTGTST